MNDVFLSEILDAPLQAISEYYAGCFASSDRAVFYAEEELGIGKDEAARLRIGFADRSLGKQLPHRRIKRGRLVRDRLLEAGLYKANGRETMRGRVTVPIADGQGKVTGIRGFKIDPHAEGPDVILVGSDTGRDPAADPTETENEVQTPPRPSDEDDLILEENQILFTRDDRRYRIRGLERNQSMITLKINLMAARDDLVHMDTLDLVKARSRTSFIKAAANELYIDADTVKKDIGRLLLKLESLQSDRIASLKRPVVPEVRLSELEKREALALLRSPNLLERIVSDMDACGIVGESTNKLAGYLAATSRKLARPLAIVIQSSSSAGKTSLMDAVLSMMPEEDVQRFSGMTGQSLFYLESDSIRHKILAIAEDEGIRQAAYALKLLQSEGQLRHATVGRGEDGRSRTQEHRVEGPVQIFLTTTALDVDEELINRCLVLTVDESHSQTDAIQSKQRDSFTRNSAEAGLAAKKLKALHQNAQRLLRPLEVFNPYAPQLTFPSHKTRMRRDHVKYLTLISTIAFLHQHQRTTHNADSEEGTFTYINVEPCDIVVANRIAGEVLGRSLDELAPQTRHLLGLLYEFIDSTARSQGIPRSAFRFTRRDVRESIHWSDTQVRRHLARLVDLEYVLVHQGRNGQRYVYELLYGGEGREDQPFLMGLIEPAKLQKPEALVQGPAHKVSNLVP